MDIRFYFPLSFSFDHSSTLFFFYHFICRETKKKELFMVAFGYIYPINSCPAAFSHSLCIQLMRFQCFTMCSDWRVFPFDLFFGFGRSIYSSTIFGLTSLIWAFSKKSHSVCASYKVQLASWRATIQCVIREKAVQILYVLRARYIFLNSFFAFIFLYARARRMQKKSTSKWTI